MELLPNDIARVILDWLTKTLTLHGRLATSLAYGFRHSKSFNVTRLLVPRLRQIASFSEDDLSLLEEAVEQNTQVTDCNINGTMGPQWVASFVKSRRSSPTLSG